MRLCDFEIAALAIALCFAAGGARAQERLEIVSWGGSYEAAQREALFEPFERATGVEIEVLRYRGELDALRARAEAEGWDVIDMVEASAIAACEEGLLRPLDREELFDGATPTGDFAPTVFRRCSAPQNRFATIWAYDDRAFPGVKPSRIEDLFDVERFPGKRALRKSPDAALEWALLAEGAPAEQIYDLLSTDRGLRLALRRLERLTGEVIWWEDPAEPARLLASGEAAIASGYNGRFFEAARGGAPIDPVWDGRIVDTAVWTIAAESDRPDLAHAFLAFALRPEPMARFAERIPYGPARRSAFERIGLHPETGAPMRDHLPNAPQLHGRRLEADSAWSSATAALRARRFAPWAERAGAERAGAERAGAERSGAE